MNNEERKEKAIAFFEDTVKGLKEISNGMPEKSREAIGCQNEIDYIEMAIKALKQDSVLDDIRAEIAQYKRITYSTDPYNLVGYCLDIIDKYRKEQTDADSN